jgi:hypothetical protein
MANNPSAVVERKKSATTSHRDTNMLLQPTSDNAPPKLHSINRNQARRKPDYFSSCEICIEPLHTCPGKAIMIIGGASDEGGTETWILHWIRNTACSPLISPNQQLPRARLVPGVRMKVVVLLLRDTMSEVKVIDLTHIGRNDLKVAILLLTATSEGQVVILPTTRNDPVAVMNPLVVLEMLYPADAL